MMMVMMFYICDLFNMVVMTMIYGKDDDDEDDKAKGDENDEGDDFSLILQVMWSIFAQILYLCSSAIGVQAALDSSKKQRSNDNSVNQFGDLLYFYREKKLDPFKGYSGDV